MLRGWYRLTFMALLVVLCAACGHSFPTTDPNVGADQKKAVLFVTPPGLDSAIMDKWKTIAQNWRQNDAIAYDWALETKAFDESFLKRVASQPIDAVIVIGNELIPQAAEAAKQTPSIHWIALQTDIDRTAPVKLEGTNFQLHILDPLPSLKANDAWVRSQIEAGASIQWITRSGWPIPTDWAPSEEADHIVDLDLLGDAWFTQLAAQVRSTAASEIVVFSPIQAAEASKVKSLRLPVTDLFASLRASLQWDAVAGRIHDALRNGEWKPGTIPYTEQEAVITNVK